MHRRIIFALIFVLLTGTIGFTAQARPKVPANSINRPGVYTEETAGSNQPITGVSTSNVAFIGIADKGPMGKAVPITTWNQFVTQFGGVQDKGYLGYAVYAFLQEGGTRCYVVRVSNSTALHTGLKMLDAVKDVNLIAIPDWAGDQVAISLGLNYCQNRRDCFLIADPPAGSSLDDVIRFKTRNPSFNSSYGAMYYPWMMVNGPVSNQKKLIPPSASVAGRYAYTDTTRGVHKAPAGMGNGLLRLTTATEIIVSSQDASRLNVAGINPIVSNPSGFYIWGSRTLSQDPEWKYLSIRRLQIYIDQSIRTGLEWVTFEPSAPPLWSRVQQSISSFLTPLWRKGAFIGNKAEEAFFVKVDAENNPSATISQGKLNITIGFAPLRPAEFIILHISLNIKSN